MWKLTKLSTLLSHLSLKSDHAIKAFKIKQDFLSEALDLKLNGLMRDLIRILIWPN